MCHMSSKAHKSELNALIYGGNSRDSSSEEELDACGEGEGEDKTAERETSKGLMKAVD